LEIGWHRRLNEGFEVGLDYGGNALECGELHDLSGSDAVLLRCEHILQRFQTELEADSASVFKAIDNSASGAGDLHIDVIEAVRLHSLGKGFLDAGLDHLDGWVGDTRRHGVIEDLNPYGACLMCSDLVELKGTEQYDYRLWSSCRDFG